MPCCDPAILRQCRVLHESPCGRRKKLNAGSSPTCLLWTADTNSHKPCRFHAALMPRSAVALSGRFQNGMIVAWQGNGMACVNQTRPHCVNKMGKTKSKPLAERHGRGTAWYVWISLKSSTWKLPWKLGFVTVAGYVHSSQKLSPVNITVVTFIIRTNRMPACTIEWKCMTYTICRIYKPGTTWWWAVNLLETCRGYLSE
jgi:hypothetical protein